ncbi:SpoIIE family protein phosphatase [Streptomyces sp. NPDC049040]|uniref:SpoIIE family protein phosphatase n=1 Tax=Streptomyces sp. NPDC049040 TaxID=3365593 RepID=UPI003718D3F5
MSSRRDVTAAEPVDVLAVLDSGLAVTTWTASAERLWGYPAAEVLHRPVARLLAPGASAPADALAAGRPWAGRVRVSRRDGDEEEVGLRASALHDGDGTAGWLLCAYDPLARPALDPAALRALVEHAPFSLATWDEDLRCTWFNDSVHDRAIFRSGPELGRHVTDLFDARHPAFLESAMRQVLESGAPLIRHELWPATAAESEGHYSWVTFLRLEGRDGRPLGVCSVAMHGSGGQERGRLRLLSEAERAVGTSLDPMVTAQELAETAVPNLADYATIDLTEAVRLGREPLERLKATNTGIPGFYRAGMASIHSDFRESLWALGTAVFVPPESPFTAVLKSRRSHFEPILDTSPGGWLDNDPDRARVIRRTGMHSLMIVPLHARGAMLGIAVFVRSENPDPFTPSDLVLAEDLVARASLSLDNALSYTRERTTALTLQRALLPHRLSGADAVEVASRYLPSDAHRGVGGDWFDVFPCAGGRVALVVGDVVGHGINAAATMGQLRTMVRTLAKLKMPPDELLRHVDELVVEMTWEDSQDGDALSAAVGATCLYVLYDSRARRCTMASAGHPPPAVIAPDGSVDFVDVPPGAPIGVGLASFTSVTVELAEGSVLALYTDGLIETRDADIDQGLERLRTALAVPAASLDDLCASVVDTMVSGGPADDDTTLLLARTLAPGPGLAPGPASDRGHDPAAGTPPG